MTVKNDIIKKVNTFQKRRNKGKGYPYHRYTSFDYCYNYFYSSYRNGKIRDLASKKNMEMSCLQLGFFLANWGMMRGSTNLIERSVKKFEPVIEAISKMNGELWKIDVPDYKDDDVIEKILTCKEILVNSIKEKNEKKPTDTLITKIMLGVFGNVPAFDTNFSAGFFKKRYKKGCKTLNETSLGKIYKFYSDNPIIDSQSSKIYTIDFSNPKKKVFPYTRAKIIDMYGFTRRKKSKKKK